VPRFWRKFSSSPPYRNLNGPEDFVLNPLFLCGILLLVFFFPRAHFDDYSPFFTFWFLFFLRCHGNPSAERPPSRLKVFVRGVVVGPGVARERARGRDGAIFSATPAFFSAGTLLSVGRTRLPFSNDRDMTFFFSPPSFLEGNQVNLCLQIFSLFPLVAPILGNFEFPMFVSLDS